MVSTHHVDTITFAYTYIFVLRFPTTICIQTKYTHDILCHNQLIVDISSEVVGRIVEKLYANNPALTEIKWNESFQFSPHFFCLFLYHFDYN